MCAFNPSIHHQIPSRIPLINHLISCFVPSLHPIESLIEKLLFIPLSNHHIPMKGQSSICQPCQVNNKERQYREEMNPLRDFFDECCEFDLIKMDIQGHELYALQGMSRILESQNLKLILEFWPEALLESNTKPDELLSYLDSKHFNIYDFQNLGDRIDSGNFDDWARSIQDHTNLFCVKHSS